MIKKFYTNIDVVTAAKQRVKNIFKSHEKVELSISGGKDSICLSDIIYKLCVSGEIDKSKLVVDFIDEEAIYPCVEKVVKNLRLKWKSIGVEFRWWCVEVRHFNCFNQLTNDESFICWDRHKKDVWIRPMPPFAITGHPLLRPREDNYQAFLPRVNRGVISLQGLRVSESFQRYKTIASQKQLKSAYPIYDWTDTDVWRYIRDNGLEIPDAYMYMYQVGTSRNAMRISQFFSIDTARSLVNMCEFYPDLFNKICKREPNAYMAMLYFDTELFRRQKKTKQSNPEEEIDFKAKVLELINTNGYFTTKEQLRILGKIKRFVLLNSTVMDNKAYKTAYNILIGGDPKDRTYRALCTQVGELKLKGAKK